MAPMCCSDEKADGAMPHTIAELYGNHDIAHWLLEHGAKDELSLLEHFIAVCARGDGATANAMLAADPTFAGVATLSIRRYAALSG